MINYQTTDTITSKKMLREMNSLKDRFCGFKFFDCRYNQKTVIVDVVLSDTNHIQLLTKRGEGEITGFTNEGDLLHSGKQGQYLGKDIKKLLLFIPNEVKTHLKEQYGISSYIALTDIESLFKGKFKDKETATSFVVETVGERFGDTLELWEKVTESPIYLKFFKAKFDRIPDNLEDYHPDVTWDYLDNLQEYLIKEI
jgi:hypothetical protein